MIVRDQNNAPMSGVTVAFSVTAGLGTVSPGTVVTGSDGIARVTSWIMGATPGTNVLTATAAGLPAIVFNATSVRAPVSIEVVASPTQQAAVSTAVADPPGVRVRDANNVPMEGVTVLFQVTLGSGAVNPTSVVTDASGLAVVTSWTLGPNPGPNTVTATVSGLAPVSFNATGLIIPATLEAITVVNQVAQVGTAVAAPPGVRARDANDAPLAGVIVNFAVSGGGSIAPTTIVTDANGVAQLTSWTLGAVQGQNSVTASAAGVPSVLFIATGTAAPAPTAIEAVTATAQQAPAGAPVANPPGVRILDQFGAPMPGVGVVFSVVSGGGSVVPTAAVTTGADGIARLTSWTLGTAPGPNSVAAAVVGAPSVTLTFNATGVLVPGSIEALPPVNQEAVRGTAVDDPPAVLVRNQFGAPLQGVSVAFNVTSGGGTVVPENQLTGADGVARLTSWTLGTATGANSVTATVAGLAPVVFTATALPHPCDPINIALGADVPGTLSTSSCLLPNGDGEFVVFYSFTITEQKAVRVTQSSPPVGQPGHFDTWVLLLKSNGDLVADNDDVQSNVILNSELTVLLAPGTYFVAASSFLPGATGSFTVRVEETSANVTNCTEFFATQAVTTQQSLSGSDCQNASFLSDLFIVYLKAGQQITVDMSSTDVDAYLYLFTISGTLLTEDNDSGPGSDARLTFTVTQDGYYVVAATSAFVSQAGAYTLVIQ